MNRSELTKENMRILTGKEIGHRKAIPVTKENLEEAKRLSEEMIAFLDENNGSFEGQFENALALNACQVDPTDPPFSFFIVGDYIHIDKKPEGFMVGDKICLKSDKKELDIRTVLRTKVTDEDYEDLQEDSDLIEITGNGATVKKEIVDQDGWKLVKPKFTTENYYFEHRVIFNPSIYHALETKLEKRVRVQEKTGRVIDEDHTSAIRNTFRANEACMSFPNRQEKKVDRFIEIIAEYDVIEDGKLVHKKETMTGLKSHVFQHEHDHSLGYDIHFGFGDKEFMRMEDRVRENGKTMKEVAEELRAKGEIKDEKEESTQEIEEKESKEVKKTKEVKLK